MGVTVLVPAHDEAARIGATVTAALGIRGVTRVLVIDDASTDATSDLAAAAGAEVLRLPANVGKGAALDAGLARVRADADVLMMLDGDLGASAAQGALLLEPVLSDEAAMSVAAFPRPAGKAGFGLVKGLARFGIRALGGQAGRSFAATAPLSGQRAMTRACWEQVTPFAFGYGVEVALTVRALRSGMTIVEVPTTMTHAATERNAAGFTHRGRQFLHVARALLRLTFEPRG
ncbi:MAG TPA: glycosyltransferase family 2 protein [Coriobacteriia bacterium]